MSNSWQAYYSLLVINLVQTECNETVFKMTQTEYETKQLPHDTVHDVEHILACAAIADRHIE